MMTMQTGGADQTATTAAEKSKGGMTAIRSREEIDKSGQNGMNLFTMAKHCTERTEKTATEGMATAVGSSSSRGQGGQTGAGQQMVVAVEMAASSSGANQVSS